MCAERSQFISCKVYYSYFQILEIKFGNIKFFITLKITKNTRENKDERRIFMILYGT